MQNLLNVPSSMSSVSADKILANQLILMPRKRKYKVSVDGS